MKIQLSNNELKVDRLLAQYRDDFIISCGDNVPYDAPVLTDARIWNSKLYDFCLRLPKGADLHVHGGALLPLAELLEYLKTRDDILVNPHDEKPGMMYYLKDVIQNASCTASKNTSPCVIVKDAHETKPMDNSLNASPHMTIKDAHETEPMDNSLNASPHAIVKDAHETKPMDNSLNASPHAIVKDAHETEPIDNSLNASPHVIVKDAHETEPMDNSLNTFPYMTIGEALSSGTMTEEQFLKYWTTAGVASGQRAWDFFENLFTIQGTLNASPDIIRSNYYDAFKYYYRCGIIHCQCRVLFFGSHEDAETKAGAILDAYEAFHREQPDFCATVIGIGLKNKVLPMVLTEELYENAMYLAGCERFRNAGAFYSTDSFVEPPSTKISKESHSIESACDPSSIKTVNFNALDSKSSGDTIPSGPFIIGWDLVNEEDISRPLEDFAWCLDEFKKKHPDMVLTLHAGESLDPANENVLRALEFGADRIGHGMNFYRYPEALKMLAERNVCLEVCPISNQSLGFVPDLRQHPAKEYLRQGVPMVLGSDNPGLQEHTALTDDFFMAILSWELSLSDVKKLCYHSLKYCGLDDARKHALIDIWEKQWEEFIVSFCNN